MLITYNNKYIALVSNIKLLTVLLAYKVCLAILLVHIKKNESINVGGKKIHLLGVWWLKQPGSVWKVWLDMSKVADPQRSKHNIVDGVVLTLS